MKNNEETRQSAADEVKQNASRTPDVDSAFTRRAEEIADQINRRISEEAESNKSGFSEADIADGETPLDQNVKLMSPCAWCCVGFSVRGSVLSGLCSFSV